MQEKRITKTITEYDLITSNRGGEKTVRSYKATIELLKEEKLPF